MLNNQEDKPEQIIVNLSQDKIEVSEDNLENIIENEVKDIDQENLDNTGEDIANPLIGDNEEEHPENERRASIDKLQTNYTEDR